MGIKRIVDTSFWTDGKIDEFTPEDKYFMLYLLTNPFSTQLGIYEISIKQVAFHLGYSMDAVKALIERFENNYAMIVFSKPTNEIAIKNFLRHSIIKGGAPVRDCLIKEMKKVKNKGLISTVFAHIKDSEDLNETVKNIIAEYEEKNGTLSYSNEKHNDNDNENENEVSYPVSYYDTYNDTSDVSSKKPVSKKKETTRTLFERLLPEYIIPDKLQAKMREWITYKMERKEAYQEQGMKTLLRKIENNQIEYGEQAVCDLIDDCMASNWKGIIFDRLKEKPKKPRYGNFDVNEAFQNALKRTEAEMHHSDKNAKTAGNDKSVRERAEALKQRLS